MHSFILSSPLIAQDTLESASKDSVESSSQQPPVADGVNSENVVTEGAGSPEGQLVKGSLPEDLQVKDVDQGAKVTKKVGIVGSNVEPPHEGGMGSGMLVCLVIAVLSSVGFGGTLVYALFARKEARKFEDAVKSKEPTYLLDGEAKKLVSELREEVVRASSAHDERIKQDEESLRHLHEEARGEAKEAQKAAIDTVEDFKGKLNQTLGHVTDYLKKFAADAAATKTEVAEIKEYSKAVADLTEKKEEEIQLYKNGVHLQLLKPLLRSFIEGYDKLVVLEKELNEPELMQFRESVEEALEDCGVRKVQDIPNSVDETDHKLWNVLSAAQKTEDQSLHRTIANVDKECFICEHEGRTVVVRKGQIVAYKFEEESSPEDKEQ